jgi:phage shock protein PspC (stress-responsive transcriptional regulator)
LTEPIKKLYRSRDGAQLAGICAGLGTYLRLDPVFVRVVTLTVTFLTGP